ncbi:TAT-variant-translocated molybdopterin oxidoreductase [Planctomycetaceae bacterium SH139]
MTENTTPSSSRYWRSLDELQKTPEFEQFLHREFPVAASEYPEGVSRRRWLQLMGASLAMGGAIGCRYPEETIAPFVIRPEGRVPGEPYSRATNFQLANRVHHLLVSCVDGRPLKIEGNAAHPASNGGTDQYVQASVLQLYDPDRLGVLLQKQGAKRVESDWAAFDSYAVALTESLQKSGGRLAVLMPPTASPSLLRMLAALRVALPSTSVCVYDSVGQGVAERAVAAVAGDPAVVRYDLSQAGVVLDVSADLLGAHPGFLQHASGYASRRQPKGDMSRLYAVETAFSATGMSSDSRFALAPSQLPAFLGAVERAVDELLGGAVHDHGEDEPDYDSLETEAERLARFIDVLAHDLVDAKGASVVAVGESLGVDAVAAGLRINAKLGNIGKTVLFADAIPSRLGETVGIEELAEQLDAGQVDALLVLGGNPVFSAPSDLQLAKLIGRVEDSIYLGEYDDETAVVCKWALPLSHPLESWGDCFGDRGHYGVCQPHILPLLGGRSELEVLARMLGMDEVSGDQIVRRTADIEAKGSLSDRQWRELLFHGFAEDLVVDMAERTVSTDGEPLPGEPVVFDRESIDRDAIDVMFVPADGIYDGRFANNGWLQEMPQALTKLTWDNAALMNPLTAEALGVRHGVMVALTLNGSTVELPVFEIPGMALGGIVVACGYGRTRAGAVGGSDELGIAPVGVDVAPLRTTASMQMALAIEARPRPRSEYVLATTQNHWAIDELGREETIERSYQLVREGTQELYNILPDFAKSMGVHSPIQESLWQEPIDQIEELVAKEEIPYIPQWGMAIDLSKCIGCNACVVACQSENNVPIVGKEQVMMGREMHWMRIDRYFQGTPERAEVVQEPMLCQHCETAPCEQVCPVAATVHTDDGINAMAYNRCIGTRYCANNCPFKVRRFNYFNWNEDVGVGYGIDAFPGNIEKANRKLQQLVLNPEVTVRGRGVMEKCTFCIQRVEAGKINARREGGRKIADGEVKTACQTACPTSAIVFGDIQDTQSEVYEWRKDPRDYAMLDQLNIKPRVTYLARISNPNVRLMSAQQLKDLVYWPKKAAQLEAAHHDHGGHGDEHHGDEHGDKKHDEEHAADASH